MLPYRKLFLLWSRSRSRHPTIVAKTAAARLKHWSATCFRGDWKVWRCSCAGPKIGLYGYALPPPEGHSWRHTNHPKELLARAVEHLDHIMGAQQQPANVQACRMLPNPLITASSSQGSVRSGPESDSHTSHQWRRLGFVSDHVVMDKGTWLWTRAHACHSPKLVNFAATPSTNFYSVRTFIIYVCTTPRNLHTKIAMVPLK